MNDITENTSIRPIETLAHEIAVRAKKADDHVVAAALLFREVRARIERGELGPDVKWRSWMCSNIKLSISRLFELMRIADAEDHYKELERSRRANREKQKAFREKVKAERVEARKVKQKIELDPERAEMIEWAKAAAIEDIREVLEHIAKLQGSRVALASNGEAETMHLH